MERPFPAYKGSEPYVFVSYAHTDAEAVYKLLAALHSDGHRIWYDEGIAPGSSWRSELAYAIQNAAQVLFIATPASVNSRNCQREVEFALSHGVDVSLCFLEETDLPPALAFELGSHQAVIATHHDWPTFVDRVGQLLRSEQLPEPRGKAATARKAGKRAAFIGAATLCLLLVAAGLLWRSYDTAPATQAINAPPTIDNPVRVAVRPLRNASGDRKLEWVGEGLADLLRDSLSSSRYAVVLSQPAWNNIVADHATDDDLFAAALANGIDYVLSGYLIPDQDKLLLNVRVTHLQTGLDVVSQSFGDLDPSSVVNSAAQISIVAKQGMKIPRENNLQSLSADFTADNLAAYEAYVSGTQSYNEFQYEQAEQAFETALEIDPDFHPARLRLANVQSSSGRVDTALATLQNIPPDAALGDRERAYVDGLRQLLEGNPEQSIATYETLLAKLPYDIDGQLSLAQAQYQSYQEPAAIATLKTLARQEPKNHHVWSSISFIAMAMNDLPEAQAALDRYVTLAPDLANPRELLGALALKRNDFELAKAQYARALETDPGYELARIGLARVELLSGSYLEAEAMLRRIRSATDVSPRSRIGAAFDLAAMARAEGRYKEATTQFDPVMSLLEDEGTRVGWHWSQKALAAMDLGDTALAATYVTQALSRMNQEGASPTRLLFLKARFEIFQGETKALEATLKELLSHQLPKGNPDRTEERAAAYLRGLAALSDNRNEAALTHMKEAMRLEGFEYELYRYGWARALAAAGQTRAAMNACELAATERINYLAQDPRTDLEADRRQARNLQLELLRALGKQQEATRLQAKIAKHWPRAN